MDWQTILNKLRLIKIEFEKSYKCINIDRPTKDETLLKHVEKLFRCLEEIRVILNVHYSRLTQSHKAAADNFFTDIRGRLENVLSRRNIQADIPNSLHEEIKYAACVKEIALTASNNQLPSPSSPEEKIVNMSLSVTEFIGLITKIIPEFDGKFTNLQSFFDALDLVESIKETHENIAVNVIKTKLKGSARNLISNESTIVSIKTTLKQVVKGESTEVLTAKIMNVRQGNKSANLFVSEVEELTKALSNAYISDGLPLQLAEKYSTQVAVKSMTKNASNDRVRLIMESGNFVTMNDAVSKFVSSCTDISSTSDVRYFKSNWNGHRNGRGRGNGNNRGRGQGRYRGNNRRGSGNHNSNWNNNTNVNSRDNRNRNVRVVNEEHNDSGNLNHPLREQ